MRRDGSTGYDGMEAMHDDESDDQIDLRPSHPLANIPMLLEILSKAGEPANGQGVVQLHRRYEDRQGNKDRSQYSLPL